MSRAEKLRDGKEIQHAVGRLPAKPSQQDLVRLAELIAAVSIKRPVPARSISLYVRLHLRGILPTPKIAEVRELAKQAVRRDTPAPAKPDTPVSGPVASRVAAEILGVPHKALLDMLRQPFYRRAWGWPRCWDGRTWLFRREVLEYPERFLDLPLAEPPHCLPPNCLRVDQVADLTIAPDARAVRSAA